MTTHRAFAAAALASPTAITPKNFSASMKSEFEGGVEGQLSFFLFPLTPHFHSFPLLASYLAKDLSRTGRSARGGVHT